MMCKQESKGPTYDAESLEKVHIDDDYNVFDTARQHSEQSESINNTYEVKIVDSNIIPNSTDMCDNEIKDEQNVEEPEDEHRTDDKARTYLYNETTFANPEYLKKAQWEKPCLYNVQYDKNDLANMFAPESEETIQLEEKSRSKLGALSSDDETLTSGSDDEEYAMAVRNFKKFFRRKGKFVRQPREEKKSVRQREKKKGKSDRKCFRCSDPNHLIGDCPKPSRNKDQKAFIGGSWSDSKNDAEDKTNDETCLMAQSSNEVTLNSSYHSDDASSLDNESMQIEYDSLCEISLKIINKNKILETKRDLLEKEILELNEKIKKLERSKEIEIVCLGFDDSKVSTSGTKNMSFVGSSAEKVTDGSTIKVHESTLPRSVCLRTCLKLDEWIKDSGCSKHMIGNKSLFSTYKAYDGGNVVFGSNLKGKIIGKGSSIIAIRTDHSQESDNEVQFEAYYDAQGITHNFSAPSTPQSNGVVERKNRTLQEMSRTMLNEQSIPQKFWCNVVDTSTFILYRILIRPILGKTSYEIFRGRKPSLEYFKVFRRKCFILNTKDYLTKFDPKSYEGVFLRYSQNSKAYVVLNKHTMKVKESLNVTFDESHPPAKLSPLVDDDVGEK
ncbi:retrovirus-related pol polyprotein from transposon TNT 1-94 [Tanacetum coccineum]